MLYDPQWETTVAPVAKPDIYALPTLIAWLERQPPEQTYKYYNCAGACLLDLYRVAHGLGVSSSDEYCYLAKKTGWGRDIAADHPRTFGAALARARALAEEA